MMEVECNNTDKGEKEMEEVDMSMRYVDRETRLKRKYSWAVKPFRSVPVVTQTSFLCMLGVDSDRKLP